MFLRMITNALPALKYNLTLIWPVQEETYNALRFSRYEDIIIFLVTYPIIPLLSDTTRILHLSCFIRLRASNKLGSPEIEILRRV